MSIRYRCEECGAAFKIRDSLAGTRGKCPQCRVKFTVPNDSVLTEEEFAAAEQTARSVHESSPKLGDVASSGTLLEPASKPNLTPPAASSSSAKLPASKPVPPPPPPPPAPPIESIEELEEPSEPEPEAASAEAAEDEFDAADFLMDDSDPTAKKSAGLAKQEAGPEKPATDALGRRYFGAGPKAAVKPADPDEVGASVTTTANIPQEPSRPKTDWKKVQKDLIRRSPLILVFAILAGVTYFMSNRYLAPRPELPVLSAVSGKVLVNGKPLSNVIIHLTPINATQATSANGSKIRLADAVGLIDDEGNYRLSYLNLSGAPRGKSRVWFEPLTPADYKRIPTRYQTAGSEIRDVREAGNEGGKFDFDLKME